MPFSITCPHCDAKLKTAADVTGKRIECPKCDETFKVTVDDIEEVTTKSGLARAASRRLSSDDDDLPRSRQRSDDDDDTPRGRRGRDANEDNSSTRRRKKKKQESNTGLMIGLIGGGLVVVGLLVFGLIYLLRDKKSDSKDEANNSNSSQQNSNSNAGAPLGSLRPIGQGNGGGQVAPVKAGRPFAARELLPFAPANTALVVAIDVDQILQIQQIRPFIDKALQGPQTAEGMKKLEEAGLSLNDFGTFLIAMPDPTKKASTEEAVIVVRMKRALDKEKIIEVTEAEQDKDGLCTTRDGKMNFIFSGTDTVILSNQAESLTALQKKKGGKIDVDPSISDLMKKSSTSQVAVVISGKMFNSPEFGAALGSMPGLGGQPGLADLKKAKGMGLFAGVTGSQLEISIVMKLADAAAASALVKESQKQMQGMKNNPQIAQISQQLPQIGNLINEVANSARVSSSGDEMTTSLSVNFQSLITTIQNLTSQQGGPGQGFPGGPGQGYPGGPGQGYPGGPKYPGGPGKGYPGAPGSGFPGGPGKGFPGAPGSGFPGAPGQGMPKFPGNPGPGFPKPPGGPGTGFPMNPG